MCVYMCKMKLIYLLFFRADFYYILHVVWKKTAWFCHSSKLLIKICMFMKTLFYTLWCWIDLKRLGNVTFVIIRGSQGEKCYFSWASSLLKVSQHEIFPNETPGPPCFSPFAGLLEKIICCRNNCISGKMFVFDVD